MVISCTQRVAPACTRHRYSYMRCTRMRMMNVWIPPTAAHVVRLNECACACVCARISRACCTIRTAYTHAYRSNLENNNAHATHANMHARTHSKRCCCGDSCCYRYLYVHMCSYLSLFRAFWAQYYYAYVRMRVCAFALPGIQRRSV